MSWQAVELVRDHSRAAGQTRTIALVLASYANEEDGNGNPYGNVWPSIETIRKGTGGRKDENGKLKGGATRKTVVDARRWLIENNEAEIVGTRPSHTGTPIPVLDFTPLLLRSKEPSEDLDPRAPARAPSDSDSVSGLPFTSVSGSPSEPLGGSERTLEGCSERTLGVLPANPSKAKGSPSEPLGGEGKGLLSEPLGGGLSVSSAGGGIQTEAQRAAERREDEEELQKLEAQLERSGFSEATERAIADLRARLDRDEVAA